MLVLVTVESLKFEMRQTETLLRVRSGESLEHDRSGANKVAAAAITAILALGAGSPVEAADWPNWRGPDHNGISAEQLPEDLSAAETAWRAELGTGFATVSVVGGRVLTMGNSDGHDVVWCLDAATGEVIWKHRYPCPLDPRYYEGGPGGTPTIEAATNSVYTLSKKGHAFRLALDDGSVRWSRDLLEDYGLELPEWSFACSPVVVGDHIIFNVGAAGWALDKNTGETVWRSDRKRPGYATVAVSYTHLTLPTNA